MYPTKGNVLWSRDNNEPAKAVFWALKEAFTSALILLHFDREKEIVVETDASDFVYAGVLSHHHNQWILNTVAFFSKK